MEIEKELYPLAKLLEWISKYFLLIIYILINLY